MRTFSSVSRVTSVNRLLSGEIFISHHEGGTTGSLSSLTDEGVFYFWDKFWVRKSFGVNIFGQKLILIFSD